MLSGSWDEQRIYPLLTNLLENAVKHGSMLDPITVSVHGEPEQIVLAVHNLGAPISEKEFRRIFEPLARIETGRASNSRGSSLGLGLYIAREIVRAHGGSIDVASNEEVGTTFTDTQPSMTSPGNRRRRYITSRSIGCVTASSGQSETGSGRHDWRIWLSRRKRAPSRSSQPIPRLISDFPSPVYRAMLAMLEGLQRHNRSQLLLRIRLRRIRALGRSHASFRPIPPE